MTPEKLISLKSLMARNSLVGRMALPSAEMRYEHARIQEAHDILLAHFASLPAAAKRENRRNVTYTSVVDAGSRFAFSDRFNYHVTALSGADVPAEIELMGRLGFPAPALQCVRNVAGDEATTSLWVSLGESDGRFRTSVYGPVDKVGRGARLVAEQTLTMLQEKFAASVGPFEIFVGWGLDFINGELEGVKLYTHVDSSQLNAFDRMLAESWGIRVPPQIWRLDQHFGAARRYNLSGEVTSVKLILMQVDSPQPAAELAEVIEPILVDSSSDTFNLPWDRVRLRAFNFDYSTSGEFEKCIAYYYYPHKAGA